MAPQDSKKRNSLHVIRPTSMEAEGDMSDQKELLKEMRTVSALLREFLETVGSKRRARYRALTEKEAVLGATCLTQVKNSPAPPDQVVITSVVQKAEGTFYEVSYPTGRRLNSSRPLHQLLMPREEEEQEAEESGRVPASTRAQRRRRSE